MATGKFIAYYRVSTSKQGKSGLGLDAQRAAVANYLNGGRWTIKAEFTEVESGRCSERPQLARALATARVHRLPLIVAKVDRLTRSVAFLSQLLEAGVDVRFADLPSIEGPTGRFMLQQMAAVAELEAGLISTRTKAALAQAKERGVRLGGNRGSIISKEAQLAGNASRLRKAMARANDLAPTIAEIKGTGVTSLNGIAYALNERSIPTPRGNGHWSAVQVQRLLAQLQG
jgi:DNA invertase Pin-like site-specific DNA recombinase